jgi:hypothetical protein
MSEAIHERLQDRMPEVARGSATWDAADLAHLASCAECGAAWLLISAATGVGANVEHDFDATAAAQVVTARLRQARPIHRRAWVRTLVGVAAAASIALILDRPAAPVPVPVAPIPADARLLPELDSLNVDELTLIADGLETPLAETPLGSPTSLDDLDTTQLTRVLRALEG